MKESLKTGITFGLTSCTITTLSLIISLYSGTNSRGIVIGGILTITIADSLSNALGMHISEEADHSRTPMGSNSSNISFKALYCCICYPFTDI